MADNDNQDSVMIVIDGATKPNAAWTSFATEDMCARRVIPAEHNKLFAPNRKVILFAVYQHNASGTTALRTNSDQKPSYGFECNAGSGHMVLTEYDPQGQGSGARRATFGLSSHGGASDNAVEQWNNNLGQIPAQGVVMLDAETTNARIDDAKAITTDDVPLG